MQPESTSQSFIKSSSNDDFCQRIVQERKDVSPIVSSIQSAPDNCSKVLAIFTNKVVQMEKQRHPATGENPVGAAECKVKVYEGKTKRGGSIGTILIQDVYYTVRENEEKERNTSYDRQIISDEASSESRDQAFHSDGSGNGIDISRRNKQVVENGVLKSLKCSMQKEEDSEDCKDIDPPSPNGCHNIEHQRMNTHVHIAEDKTEPCLSHHNSKSPLSLCNREFELYRRKVLIEDHVKSRPSSSRETQNSERETTQPTENHINHMRRFAWNSPAKNLEEVSIKPTPVPVVSTSSLEVLEKSIQSASENGSRNVVSEKCGNSSKGVETHGDVTSKLREFCKFRMEQRNKKQASTLAERNVSFKKKSKGNYHRKRKGATKKDYNRNCNIFPIAVEDSQLVSRRKFQLRTDRDECRSKLLYAGAIGPFHEEMIADRTRQNCQTQNDFEATYEDMQTNETSDVQAKNGGFQGNASQLREPSLRVSTLTDVPDQKNTNKKCYRNGHQLFNISPYDKTTTDQTSLESAHFQIGCPHETVTQTSSGLDTPNMSVEHQSEVSRTLRNSPLNRQRYGQPNCQNLCVQHLPKHVVSGCRDIQGSRITYILTEPCKCRSNYVRRKAQKVKGTFSRGPKETGWCAQEQSPQLPIALTLQARRTSCIKAEHGVMNNEHCNSLQDAKWHKESTVPDAPKQPQKFTCSFSACSKTYYKDSDLTNHMRVHTNETAHQCTWVGCHMAFKRRYELHRHFRTHTGERPYPCPKCTKAFQRSDHRRQHMLHTHLKYRTK